ncbi:MAG: bifunctional serine/threonine-protein kinase/formylglycine-generating enzyme family protein [Acidobacteriota bacterium]|nr:bifunctional serine/threonine-protein kinase/formylglycine-generating enzyme family protein [Acidobacteriota bacterium]
MPKPNDIIGPYKLINRLGKGSFGEVWLAQPENEKALPVAVKLPNDPDLDFDALLQETAVWARAGQHPNVVEFIAARVFDHQAVIVSEYVPDGSLEQWLKRNGGRAPSIESAIEMARGILDGLEHLHSKNIIHRDIKPANILMHGTTPRLADFGHSRVLASTMHSSIVAGTPAYMAPEAFDAVRDKQTDLWSVGVLLYQLLSGRLPFPQRDAASLMKAILMTDPLPLPAELPAWLRQAVEAAMAKETAGRFQSAAQMRAALVRLAAQPIRETRKVEEPAKRSDVQPEPIVQPPKRPELEVEPPTLERGKVMIDVSPLIGMPGGRVKPVGLRPAVKWGVGLAAIVLAVVTYVATKTDTPVSPNSFESSGNTQPPANSGGEFTENLNGVNLVMKRLPGGEFLMGSPDGESGRDGDEGPQHRVTVPSFYIGKTEVTQAQWRKVAELPKVFMDLSHDPSHFKGDDLPVELVSYWEAREFCTRLSRLVGRTYRLPSEAEWEYACRAGTTGAYAGNLDAMTWYFGTAGAKTHPVGQKQPNRFGLYDMYGNVWEWCEDVWHDSYGGQHGDPPADGNAWLTGGEQQYRVLRGGTWGSIDRGLRSAARLRNGLGSRSIFVGVRVALSASTLHVPNSGK